MLEVWKSSNALHRRAIALCKRRAAWLPSLCSGRSTKPATNTLGMISNLLINTPLQRGVGGGHSGRTVSTVCPPRGKPLKRFSFSAPWIPRLKPGVNEKSARWTARARGGFPLPFGRGEGQGEGSGENSLTGQAFPLTPTLSPSAGEREKRSPLSWFCRLSRGCRRNESAAASVAQTGSFKS